jgi:Uma2 family endonuclease
MAVHLEKRLFTVDEYQRMIETGILTEDDRVELIKGEVVKMPSIGPDHAACVARLTILFAEQLGRRVVIWKQSPLRLPDNSVPEPDITLLKPRADFYSNALPTPEDALLVIEVSESTLEKDRRVKMPMYAAAGIAQALVINLEEKAIEIYSSPGLNGYKDFRLAHPGDALLLPDFPDAVLRAEDVLG